MLTLSLLRHAKSAWDDPGLDDFERPLAPRGVKAASAIGEYIARENLQPDLVLCSGAVRTRATLALVLPELKRPLPEVIHDDALYLALPAAILAQIRGIQGKAKKVLVVGHNPAMHALALELVGDGARNDIAALATHFPTAALATIKFQLDRWSALKPAAGTLERFVTSKRMD